MTGTVLGLLFGLFLLFLVGQALWGPLRFLLKIALRLGAGGLVLFLLNFGTSFWGWHFGVNPLSAFTVGMLGLPGLLLIGIIRHYFG